MKELEALVDALDIGILRMESGQTLAQALNDAPQLQCDSDWVQRWLELRDRLSKGQASGLDGLSNFRRSVKLHLRIRRLVQRRSLLPLIQAGAVASCTLIFLLVTQVFFAELFRLSFLELSTALLLTGIGCYWIKHLLAEYEKELWFMDWLEFISGLATRIGWGQGLLPAWRAGMHGIGRLPRELIEFLYSSYKRAESYETIPSVKRLPPSKDRLLTRCRVRWEQVHRLFVANERVLPILNKELEDAYACFCDGLERRAEVLSAKLMLPLFLCFAPSYLLILLAPLIRALYLA
jgi:hypothetical protein